MMKLKAFLKLLVALLAAASLQAAIAPTAHVAALDPAPPFPTNLRASDGTYSYMVKVSWTASAGATDYRVFRANGLDGNKTSMANVTTPYYDDYSAWGGLQIHHYWVIACINGSNCSGGGNDFGTPDSGFRGLDTPDVSASDGTYTDKVRVTWTSIQAAESYTLYRGTSEAGYSTSQSNLTTTSYDDTNAVRGTLYYYWVKAVAPIDESSMGGPNTGYRNYSAPTGVAATDGTYTDKVRVNWAGSANAARYQVWREPAAGGTAQKLGALVSPPFDDATAVPGVSYDYTVTACNADETICSQRSAEDSGYRTLTAPTGVAASDGMYADKVRVTWNTSTGATSYSVLRATSPTGTRTEIAAPTGRPYDDVSAAPNAVYHYWVKACTALVCSAASGSDSGYRSAVQLRTYLPLVLK